jgi:hypothetical protein
MVVFVFNIPKRTKTGKIYPVKEHKSPDGEVAV